MPPHTPEVEFSDDELLDFEKPPQQEGTNTRAENRKRKVDEILDRCHQPEEDIALGLAELLAQSHTVAEVQRYIEHRVLHGILIRMISRRVPNEGDMYTFVITAIDGVSTGSFLDISVGADASLYCRPQQS